MEKVIYYSLPAVIVLLAFVIYLTRRERLKTVDFSVPIMSTDNSEPLIDIELLDKFDLSTVRPINIPSDRISGLSNIVQNMPPLLTNLKVVFSDNLYRVTFSPEITKGLSEGSLTLKNSLEGGVRALAQDSTGKIVQGKGSVGSLHKLDGLQIAAMAVAAWQILSVAVAQKHLADINRKLDEIRTSLNGIKSWLEADRLGKLEGNLKYMNTIAETLYEGTLTEGDLVIYRSIVEEIERETLQVIASQHKDIDRFIDQLKQVELTNWIGTDEDAKIVSDNIEEFDALMQTLCVALYVRSTACQLLLGLPGNHTVAKKRACEIRSQISTFNHDLDARDELGKYIKNIKSKIFSKKAIERRNSLQANQEAAWSNRARFMQNIEATLSYVETSHARMNEVENQPFELILQLEKDGTTKIYS